MEFRGRRESSRLLLGAGELCLFHGWTSRILVLLPHLLVWGAALGFMCTVFCTVHL